MRARLVAAILVAALAACGQHEQVREQIPFNPLPLDNRPLNESDERSSIIGLARGTTIVARSGEAFGPVSAMNALDGDPSSFWMTPPHDLPQWITIALPALTRIERVGIRTTKGGFFTAKHVRFETSLDGTRWQPLTTVESADTNDAQWSAIPPAETRQLRVTLVDAPKPGSDVRLHSILATGTELEPARMGTIDGCWSINGMSAQFATKGSLVRGTLAIGKEPLELNGGADERSVRFVWTRGNDYGLAILTVAPDGKHLSGTTWHEEAIPMFYAGAWFGEREPCGVRSHPIDVPLRLVQRIGRYSAFGLSFGSDGALDAEKSAESIATVAGLLKGAGGRAQVVAHEFREKTPQANHDRAARELESVRKALLAAGVDTARVPFIAAGSATPRQEPVTDAMRAIYSSIDVEIRR